MSDHKKHVQLAKPDMGNYARIEWSIHGAPCDVIQSSVHEWITVINKDLKTGFLDASHVASSEPQSPVPNFHIRTKPEGLDLFQSSKVRDYDLPAFFKDKGMLLINGNHFTGKKQIVILDPAKKDSLQRKLDRLTDIELVLATKEIAEPYDFLKPLLKEGVEILPNDDHEAIASWIKKKVSERRPPIKGLVLAGGKSIRMGEDKGAIQYHEKDQREHTAELLSGLCEEVYLSCRPDQLNSIASDYPLLPDTFTGLGPLGAILSAFRHDPNSAWLVVACDLPLLDRQSLQGLIDNRDTEASATAFRQANTEFPEPLVTIWEPEAYSKALVFLALGYSCPRKVLINTNTRIIEPANQEALTNVNTVEEKEDLINKLSE